MDATATGSDKACRWNTASSQWDCGQVGDNAAASSGPAVMPNIVTRQNVTHLSDWAVGNNVGPTAVRLAQLSARPTPATYPFWLVGLIGLAGVALLHTRRTR